MRENKLMKDILELFPDDPRVQEVMRRKEARKRSPAAPPPPGGISIREASKKYGIPDTTLSGWARRGFITILNSDKIGRGKPTYISENALIKLLGKYIPGRGRWTLSKAMSN